MKNTQITVLMLLANCGSYTEPKGGHGSEGSVPAAASSASPDVTAASAPKSPARLSIAVDQTQVPADGVQTATATFTVTDADGAPIADASIEFASSGATDIVSAPAMTDSEGHAHATVASTIAEVKHFSAAVSGTALTALADVTFAAGPAARLRFIVTPPSTSVGAALAPAVIVAVEDAAGNLVADSDATIAITFHDNPGAATLGGSHEVSAVHGVATFAALSVDTVGDGYTLEASADGFAAGVSGSFSIAAE